MMRAPRKRALAVLLILILSMTLSLSSCDRSYDEAEVVAAAKELLPKAKELFSVYYGQGIRYIDSGFSDGQYYQADDIHLRTLGIVTVNDLKNKTYAVFSNKYSENIFSIYLTTYSGESQDFGARYVMNGTGEYMLVNRKWSPIIYDDRMEYDLDTVRAVGSKKKFINMTVDATVSDGEGNERTLEISFRLYEEKTGYRIDNPCFANYR